MKAKRSVALISLLLTALATAQCVPVFIGPRESADKTSNAASSNSNSSASSAATADEIIDRYVQALGGTQEINHISSIEAQGTFEMPEAGMTGSLVYYFKTPNKSATTLKTSDGSYRVLRVFDGTSGWERAVNAMGSGRTRQLAGAELQAQKISGDFAAPLKLKELYRSKMLKGKQKIEEKDAYVIEAVSLTGETETLYFDAETGLLLRKDYTEVSSRGKRRAESYFEDYKTIAGASQVKTPHTTSTFYPDDEEGNHIVRFKEFRANAPVNDSLFAQPRN